MSRLVQEVNPVANPHMTPGAWGGSVSTVQWSVSTVPVGPIRIIYNIKLDDRT